MFSLDNSNSILRFRLEFRFEDRFYFITIINHFVLRKVANKCIVAVVVVVVVVALFMLLWPLCPAWEPLPRNYNKRPISMFG